MRNYIFSKTVRLGALVLGKIGISARITGYRQPKIEKKKPPGSGTNGKMQSATFLCDPSFLLGHSPDQFSALIQNYRSSDWIFCAPI
jgi:hypothetical protein